MEDLEIKTCIVCGKQRIPVFALIKKDQSMTFVDKSETVLLELSKENLDYLLKMVSTISDTSESKLPTDVSYHSTPNFKIIETRLLELEDIEVLATVPNIFNLNTREQQECNLPEKLNKLVVFYKQCGVKRVDILEAIFKSRHEIQEYLIFNKSTDILSYHKFVEYMEYTVDVDNNQHRAEYEHYLNNPELYVTGQIFNKK